MRPLFALLLLLPHLFTGALSARSHPNAATVPDGYPFLFGAQYYRAPTPETECWETDLSRMKELGFTDVKFWVQWRWNNRRENEYDFGDLDRLTDLAEKNGLRVTFNTIFDVAPVWLYEKYPDAKQLANDGRRIEPYTVGHRQGGGHPGPCYNHPGALEARKAFMRQAILHFRDRKGVRFWDVWNEPELSFPQRDAQLDRLVCYCDHCRAEFIGWLQRKYRDIETLNRIWGRCYNDWEEVELPRNTETIKDFIDWRLFHSYTMTREAQWRLEMVRELAPEQAAYLHVVPNTMQPFNAVSTCTDDFAVAEMCDVFAATMNNGPFFTPQVLSAGRGKICYNVESHINGGGITTHQAMLGMDDLLHDFIPQIGLGIKGFLFWQYRPEVLGIEAPAWGLTQLDGTDREITRAASRFVRTLAPVSDKLMRSFPQAPQIGIWKSAGNEIFHYCMFRNFDGLAAGVNAYAEYCYRNSYGYRFVNSEGLERLDGIRVLILPDCYYLSQREAEAIDAWVRKGGTLLVEAHAGGYNDDTGRHSRTLPGLGLDDKWNLREKNTTSTFRLKLDTQEGVNVRLSEDAAKALRDFGVSGGPYVPVAMRNGDILWGALRYADAITTVSPTYANEIQTPEFGEGLDGVLRERSYALQGILNGIDVAGFDPATDKRIAANYTVEDRSGKAVCKAKLQEELGLEVRDDRPLMVMVTRLTRQKGMDLVMYALDRILAGGVQVAVLDENDQTVVTAQASPNAAGFSFKTLDSEIRFGELPAGSYTYMVIVTDSNGDNLCFTSDFTVSDGSASTGTYWSVKDTEGAKLLDSIQEVQDSFTSATESTLGWLESLFH